MRESDINFYKRSLKNDNIERDKKRSLANKNSLWYISTSYKKFWEESVKELLDGVNNLKLTVRTRSRKYAILCVADMIEKKTLVKLKDLHKIYVQEKCSFQLEEKDITLTNENEGYKSSDFRDTLLNNLPVVIVYKYEENFIVPHVLKRYNGIQWLQMINDFEWPTFDALYKQKIEKAISPFLSSALSYVTSEKDRQILKLILAKLTSVSFLKKHGICGRKFSNQSLATHVVQGKHNLDKWKEIQNDSKSRYDALKKKESEITVRQQGSGRKFLAELYPELTSIMLTLFDGTGEGLRSHPRLITEVLFVEKASWMNMPRCVEILNKIGIPISLSTAYNYTENFKSGTNQAKRHHDGKNINPGISLKRSTRDKIANFSINSHYARKNVQLSLQESFDSSYSCVIARDNKSRVRCDVEVVQRPSKSWKRIQYNDHDFEKSTDRTLTPTTYQFVKEKDNHAEDNITIQLNDIPISKVQVTGPAVVLVKMSFFEPESVWRHMNELLYILSLPEYAHKFKDRSGNFVSQILLTVDGGGDERPRNKSTKFCTTLLRFILNLDRLKVISYAEHDSKMHSVERVHSAENRALSQSGVISSHSVHIKEDDEFGHQDMTKFRENMRYAAETAVKCIAGTIFAEEEIKSHVAPEEDSWVFSKDLETKMHIFLSGDSTQKRIQNNFLCKAEGPVWKRLCETYNLSDRIRSAIQVFNAAFDPTSSFHQHYAFTSYREDDSWRGEPLKRYEIQPIVDLARLPELHYMPYEKLKELRDCYGREEPDWLTTPDMFLPSQNIKHVLKNHPEIMQNEDSEKLVHFSQLIVVPPNEILEYRKTLEEKEEQKEKERELKQELRDNPIMSYTIPQLRNVLVTKLKVPLSSKQKTKLELVRMCLDVMKTNSLSFNDIAKLV